MPKSIAPSQATFNPDFFEARANELQTTSGEALSANWELSQLDTGGGALERLAEISGVEGYAERAGYRKMSPEELNARYKGMEKPFAEPQYESVAKIMYEHQLKRQQLMERVAAGPQDAWTKGLEFGQTLLAHVLDPAEVGLQLMTTGAFAATGITAKAAQMGRAGQIALNLSDNALGAAAAESFVAAAAERDGIEYGMDDFAMNTIGGALLFEGLAQGIGAGVRGFQKLRENVKVYGEGITPDMDRVGAAQLARGNRVDVTPLMPEFRPPDSADMPALAPEARLEQARSLAEQEMQPNRKILYDDDISKEFDQIIANIPESAKLADLKALEQESLQSLDDLAKQGLLEEDFVASIKEEIDTVSKEGQFREKLTKAAIVCVGRRA